MDGRLLTRITNAALLAVVGMGVGHLAMPARADAGAASRAGFVGCLLGAGALVGWRERRARENYGDEVVRGAQWAWMTWGAVTALGLAWLAYWLMHGTSK